MFFIKAKKKTLVTKKKLFLLRKEQTQTFDSIAESKRYEYLKNDPKVHNLELQKIFPLIIPVLDMKYKNGFLTMNADPVFTGFNKDKYSFDLTYKADFVYTHDDYPNRIIIEDYKPCKKNRKNLKYAPIYHGDTYLRLRIIARLYAQFHTVIVSIKPNNKAYQEIVIVPKVKKS